MARIAVDGRVSRSWSTGVGVYTCRLLEALVPLDPHHEYLLLTAAGAPPAPLPLELAVTQLPARWRVAWPAQHLRLPLLVRRLGVDLLVSMHPAVAPVWSPCPRLVFVHDLIPLVLPDEYSRPKRAYYQTVVRWSLRGARRILVDSECTRRDCRRLLGLGEEKLRVVYGGPGIAKAGDNGDGPVAPAERPYFLYVGNKRPHKHLEALLAAFARLVEHEAVDCDLVIAGRDGPHDVETDGRRLRSLAGALGLDGRVCFPGEVPADELPALYRGALALVYLSSYEGLGLPPLEAMACGTPVVALRTSSLPEVVGDGGILLDAPEPAVVARTMSRLLSDAAERHRLSERARRQAERFSWERTARAVLEEIEAGLAAQERT